MQSVIDEAILDIPHRRGSAFERGLLAGGIGTTLFYLTIGRRGSVSDVDFIARTHAHDEDAESRWSSAVSPRCTPSASRAIRTTRTSSRARRRRMARDQTSGVIGSSLMPLGLRSSAFIR